MIRLISFCVVLAFGCSAPEKKEAPILPGAYQTTDYIPILEGKKVGVTVNHSSKIDDQHLTDTLQNMGIDLAAVYTPEHGFTGTISDGAEISYDSSKTSYQLISLYGKNKKPTAEQLSSIDIMIFDIQDVGTRFFTYISTMFYVMEACAENNIPVVILDRPNPNGSYVDGPVLEESQKSFVGIAQLPIVHGMTVGELAQMFNGEGWLANGIQCDLTVIPIKNWDHAKPYSLPQKPSPNLPDDLSISLYPSLCLFEGTIMSVGRGTDYAFQQIGHPEYPEAQHAFYPQSREGSKWPPYEGLTCYGLSWIGKQPQYSLTLKPLIDTYNLMNRDDFFNDYFKRLAGTELLQKQIEQGLTEEQIRETWQDGLQEFKRKRAKYLIYN